MADEHLDAVSDKLAPSLGGYVLALVVGLVLPLVAVAMYLLIALYLVIPFREIGRAVRRRGSSSVP